MNKPSISIFPCKIQEMGSQPVFSLGTAEVRDPMTAVQLRQRAASGPLGLGSEAVGPALSEEMPVPPALPSPQSSS